MIAGVQILGILFALVMCYFTYVYYRKNNYSYKSLLLWMAVWIGFLILASFPSTVYGVMETLKIERTVDFFVIAGFLFLSVLMFYLYATVKKTEKKTEDLVRSLALKGRKK